MSQDRKKYRKIAQQRLITEMGCCCLAAPSLTNDGKYSATNDGKYSSASAEGDLPCEGLAFEVVFGRLVLSTVSLLLVRELGALVRDYAVNLPSTLLWSAAGSGADSFSTVEDRQSVVNHMQGFQLILADRSLSDSPTTWQIQVGGNNNSAVCSFYFGLTGLTPIELDRARSISDHKLSHISTFLTTLELSEEDVFPHFAPGWILTVPMVVTAQNGDIIRFQLSPNRTSLYLQHNTNVLRAVPYCKYDATDLPERAQPHAWRFYAITHEMYTPITILQNTPPQKSTFCVADNLLNKEPSG